MNMIDLLRPIAGSDRYEAVRVRAEVDTGSAGSVDLEDVALEPTNVLRVRVRARDDLDKSWFARVFGEYYKVTGFRRLPPRGLWMELVLEAEDAVDEAVRVTIGGEPITMGGERIVI